MAVGLAACGRNGTADRERASVVIPKQTDLYLRLDHPLDSAKAKTGDVATATLESPVVAEGRDAIPRGTKFRLRVTNSQVAREKGSVGLLTLQVESFNAGGHTYNVQTLPVTEQTGPLQAAVDPKAQTPGLPLREDQARTNVLVPTNKVILFVTTEAIQL